MPQLTRKGVRIDDSFAEAFPMSGTGVVESAVRRVINLRLKGPGVFWLVPFIDRIARYVDMRIRATAFVSENTLTRDTVPVSVDAICFW
ncbi:MAG: hypothetical protein HYZ60_04065, partial [Methylocystis sp.]|nr:hypothetical protein [Methylocystis sp.]